MIEKSDDRYIVFDGNLLPGISKTEALAQLQLLTGLSEEELIEDVFSVKPVILKKTSEPELAEHFAASFKQAGLQVTAQPHSHTLESVIEVDLPFAYTQNSSAESKLETNLKKISLATSPGASRKTVEGSGYRLIFDGECLENMELEVVFNNLQHLTCASRQQVQEELFSVKPLIIIESSDIEVIDEYKHAYTQAGLRLRQENPTPNPIELFNTRLRIRHDKPEKNLRKPSYFTTFGLVLLVGLGSMGWIRAQNQWISPFAIKPAVKTISVNLDNRSKKQTISNEPVPPKVASTTPPAVTSPPVPVPEKVRKKPVAPMPPEPPKKATAEKPTEKPTDHPPQQTVAEKEQQLQRMQTQREQYSNRLRLWLAQQQNSAPSINQAGMQGKVKLLIKIARSGAIINAKVLSISGPTELKKIAISDAQNASPYPKIPQYLQGQSFALEVTIRYQSSTNTAGN
ncbi:MAG: energy transducer TonB [Pseudomonadales bacterium]|nr:energy transducer TonB [Pseudomonadales bacterium]